MGLVLLVTHFVILDDDTLRRPGSGKHDPKRMGQQRPEAGTVRGDVLCPVT